MLAEALTEFEDNAYCPKCGQLASKAWDPATAGSWDTASQHCYACEHLECTPENGDAEPGDLRFLTLDEKAVKIARARMQARTKAE